jgi:hypothetical protein
MKLLVPTLASLVLLSGPVLAQEASCPAGSTCVPPDDLKDMVTALKGQRCLKTEKPTFKLDPITIVTDKDGRIYATGGMPLPYTVQMKWCGYDVAAVGLVETTAARMIPPDWGFRFRPKATLGFLVADTFSRDKWSQGLDGGLLLEPFFFRWINVSGYVGVRSVGGGFGFDLTKNFGVHAGYAATWDGWRHNPYVSTYFAFW